MRRITVNLSKEEKEALYMLAQLERRNTRAQAAILIRAGLQRRGLLSMDNDQKTVLDSIVKELSNENL